MSVCFYVPADEAGTSAESESHQAQNSLPGVSGDDNSEMRELQEFWKKVKEDIKKVNSDDFKTQALPLARIKKIMKLDEEVKMISSEAPVLFAKAAEIFIHELTLRAWEHTENNRRRTLQRNDIAMAISKSDHFDFLIDIVPRHEVKVSKPSQDDPLRLYSTSEQVTQTPQTASTTQQQFIVQPCSQLLQQQTTASTSAPAASGVVTPHPVLVRSVVPSGDMQQVPVQLSPQQLQMIRLQLQQNPNQSFIIQPTHQQQPQIIQVTSQGQPQTQQLYIAQVATSNQEDS